MKGSKLKAVCYQYIFLPTGKTTTTNEKEQQMAMTEIEEKFFEEIRRTMLSSGPLDCLDLPKKETKSISLAEFRRELPKDFIFHLMIKAFEMKGNPLPDDLNVKDFSVYLIKEYGPLFLNKGEKTDPTYASYYSHIKLSWWKGKTWSEIFSSEIYCDVPAPNTAFIDLIEEENKTKIKDAKHLRELTGIDVSVMNELKHCLIGAREDKLFEAAKELLEQGKQYDDLMNLKVKTFDLPSKWTGFWGKEDTTAKDIIQNAIREVFSLFHFERGVMSVREVASYLNAPYSEILEIIT